MFAWPVAIGLSLFALCGDRVSESIQQRPAAACADCSGHGHRDAPLADAQIASAMTRFAGEPMSSDSLALETLLYHGERTSAYLASGAAIPLDRPRREFLERELGRTEAEVSLRIVDAHGDIRALVDARRVTIGEKAHLACEGDGDRMLSVEFNGTVLRTGLLHLWSRY